MLLFPAANISYSDFCVKQMWSKGAELHHDEVSGGAGLGVDMGWYLLTCIHWHEEEWTVEWATGKDAWSSQHQWIWEVGENKKQRKKKSMEMEFSWVRSGLFVLDGVFPPLSLKHQQPVMSCGPDMLECWAEGEVSGCWAGSLQWGELSGHCWLKVSERWIGPDLSYNCRHSMVWCTALMYCESILYPAAWWLVSYWSLNSQS